jgi:hypothetical protein
VERPSDNVSMAMIVGLLLVVVFLLALLTGAIIWLKKNVAGVGDSEVSEKPNDRQLLSDLTKLKAELSPEVFKAFQRTIVSGDSGKLAMMATAIQIALERGAQHPGFGNMLLTLGISDATPLGQAFLFGAVEIYERKFGADHHETAMTLAVVARTLARQNSPQAAAYLQRALQLYESTLPDDAELPKLRAAYEQLASQQ